MNLMFALCYEYVDVCLYFKGLKPMKGKYEEGEQYNLEQSLGGGSYGQVSLCRDAYTKKRFVKKQVRDQLVC